MKGRINSLNEAVLTVRASGPTRKRATIKAVIDTGYTGYLTLRPATIRTLQLQRISAAQVELGDGKLEWFNVYLGWVEWEGHERPIEVYEANTDPLVGMDLLRGHRLIADVWPGGALTVEKVRNKR